MAGYAVTISAKDAASGTLDSLNKRVEGLTKRFKDAQAPYKRLGENIDKLVKVSGIGRIAAGFSDLARAGTESFRSLLRVVEPLAAITGAASLAGMYKLVAAWGEYGRELANQAARAGVSATALYGLQNAAKLVGVSAETLTAGITALSDNMRNAAFGGAPNFIVALRGLAQASGDVGVSWEELRKLTPEQQLLKLADALKKVRNPTDRALLTREIFGGEGMTPFLNEGAEGIAKLAARVRELRGEMSPADVQRSKDFASAQEELKAALGGMGDRIASIVGPGFAILVRGITDLVVGTRQWTEANQDWLRSEISSRAGELVTWLKSINWREIGQEIKEFASNANSVAQALGGWQAVGEGLLLFFAGAWLTRMLLPFAQLASMFLKVPVQAAEAAVKSEAELAKVGKTGGKGGGLASFLKMGPLGIAVDAATGNLPERLVNDDLLKQFPGLQGPADRERIEHAPAEPDSRPAWQRFLMPRPGQGLLQRGLGGDGAAAGPGAGGPLAPLPAGEKARRARQAYDTFRQMGDTPSAASGRVANIEQESGFDEKARGDGGHAFGIGQHHEDRQAQFAAQFGHSMQSSSYEEQLKFYHDDPDALARKANAQMRSTPGMTAYEAGGLVSKMQERPRDTVVEMHRRGLRAEQWQHQFEGEDRTRTAGPPAPAAPATEPAGSAAPLPRGSPDMAARGDPAPLPSAAGSPGAAGASGQVNMNVRVMGAPTTVTAQASPGIGVRIDNPGLLTQ